METSIKPKCKLIGTDGNVFALASLVTNTLKKAGLKDQADEFSKKLWQCDSYGHALNLMQKYVDIK